MDGDAVADGALPDNRLVKASCIVLMLGSAGMGLTGRGAIAIVQGILGAVVAIEGFWACASYDAPAMRRLIKLMFLFAASVVVIGIIHRITLDEFCKEAGNESDNCTRTALAASVVYILGGLVLVPILVAVQILFYNRLLKADKSNLLRARAARQRLFYSSFE